MKLEAKDLAFSYHKGRTLWRNVNFSVGKGDIFSILGGNSAGKSTLLRCIMGYLSPQEGDILLDGCPLKKADAAERVRRIGYVPQIQSSAYSYELRDYIVMGRTPFLSVFEQPGKRDFEMADELMGEMGLYALRHQPFNLLSGGEQRKAAIARALIQEPELMIMDEPSNHLDYGNQFRVIDMIRRLSDKGIAVILTTHMPDHVLMLGGRAGILIHRTLEAGRVEDVVTEPALQELYHMNLHLIYEKAARRKICVPDANAFDK